MTRGDTARPVALRAVTDVGGLTHLVTDAAMAAGRRAGCYQAVCEGGQVAVPTYAHALRGLGRYPSSRCQGYTSDSAIFPNFSLSSR